MAWSNRYKQHSALKKCKHKINACSMKFYKIAGMVCARRRKERNRHKA